VLDWLKGKGEHRRTVESALNEPSFPHGMEARLKVSFASGRRIGRITAYFRHETDPYARLLAFVETKDQRGLGSKTGMALVSWLSDDLPTGRYVLCGVAGVYLGGKRDGEEEFFAGVPGGAGYGFVLTDRAGGVAAPKPNAPRITGLAWE
jgi:hypothetical protein